MSFVNTWGYLAVFLGSLIEGESVILTASSLAYFGHLNIYKIMVIAFFGTLIADQALYMVGRKYKDTIFQRFPKLNKPAEKASKYLEKFDVIFILTFRFIYGIRIVSPIVIGSLGVPPSKFIPLNLIAAIIWTVLSCSLGYFFGDIIFDIIHNIANVVKYIIISIILIFIIYYLKKKFK